MPDDPTKLSLGQKQRISTPDLYWLAGLIEGEGCWLAKSYPRKARPEVGRTATGANKALRLLIWMNDRDVIEKAHALLRCPTPVAIRFSKGARAETYGVRLTTNVAAWAMTLYPLMGARRKSKIRELLSIWMEKSSFLDGRDHAKLRGFLDQGMSQRAAGALVGISQRRVSQIAKGWRDA